MPKPDTNTAVPESSPMILVVDDMGVVRDPIAAGLRAAGYSAVSAADAKEALAAIQFHKPSLILLDLNMPDGDGLSVIRAMNAMAEEFHAPVILLTAETDRTLVVEAARLGVKDYVLKRSFSFAALLERVSKYAPLAPGQSAAASGRLRAGKEQDDTVRPLLNREESVARAEGALQGRTLSGVVMQVVSLAASPRADVAQIAQVVSRDPILSARVLQVANSATYASQRGQVTNIADAVKNIGCAAVRNIAAALGIFDAMPATTQSAFNPIRCWQHSFAVAQLCERLIMPVDSTAGGIAYLVGLCHDLADIFFQTQFGEEYASVLRVQAKSKLPLDQLEREMMGLTRDRLLATILQRIGLPDSIRVPIEAFSECERAGRIPVDPLGRILRMAEYYANGLLLASSGLAKVSPLTRAECRIAAGTENPARPDSVQLRNEILAMTGILARLSPKEEKEMMRPLVEAGDARIWLARDPVFSTFDPMIVALESMGKVELHDRLPLAASEFEGHQALVILAKSDLSTSLAPASLAKGVCAAAPILWGLTRIEAPPGDPRSVEPVLLPISLDELARFVNSAAQKPMRQAGSTW
jgi:HD-like signal output (HDOD) protein/CheY-like chemotaxis protein